MDHPAGVVPLDQLRILEVVGVLRLVLGVEVIERAHELVEAVGRGQVRVHVAQMVFAELRGHVALGFEQLGKCHVLGLKPLFGAGQTDLEQASAKTDLAGNECCASRGAALLAVPVGEERAFLGNAVDVGSLVAHHPLVVSADIPKADVVAPDDEDVGFSLLSLCIQSAKRAEREHQRNGAESFRLTSQSSFYPHVLSSCSGFRVVRTGFLSLAGGLDRAKGAGPPLTKCCAQRHGTLADTV